MRRRSRGDARIWLGRICDAGRAIGWETVYEIGRGVAFPEAYAAAFLGEPERAAAAVQGQPTTGNSGSGTTKNNKVMTNKNPGTVNATGLSNSPVPAIACARVPPITK